MDDLLIKKENKNKNKIKLLKNFFWYYIYGFYYQFLPLLLFHSAGNLINDFSKYIFDRTIGKMLYLD
jgi:hypothetical protein